MQRQIFKKARNVLSNRINNVLLHTKLEGYIGVSATHFSQVLREKGYCLWQTQIFLPAQWEHHSYILLGHRQKKWNVVQDQLAKELHCELLQAFDPTMLWFSKRVQTFSPKQTNWPCRSLWSWSAPWSLQHCPRYIELHLVLTKNFTGNFSQSLTWMLLYFLKTFLYLGGMIAMLSFTSYFSV